MGNGDRESGVLSEVLSDDGVLDSLGAGGVVYAACPPLRRAGWKMAVAGPEEGVQG